MKKLNLKQKVNNNNFYYGISIISTLISKSFIGNLFFIIVIEYFPPLDVSNKLIRELLVH